MNIDKMEFVAWMERILTRLDILAEQLRSSDKRYHLIDGEELLDNQDVLQILKISSRSLQRYRASGKLPYYRMSGKPYYKLSDVHQFIRDGLSHSVGKAST
ncbi:helix-turn-helix domain-containing protein [Chryseobacterium sp. 22543]|uniref:helix-turn-helix domain-containing protein n=1 Tax=Chryseobacterium sp. 22543 TaxID=3453940 RepID=UPI003F849958